MISPPRRDQAYPGRLPPVRQQWMRLRFGARLALIVVPLVILAAIAAVDTAAGATIAVLVVGLAAATATYVKNRTDRHNAAVERGEIPVVSDPHLVDENPASLPPEVLSKLRLDSLEPAGIGRVRRFDGGWIIGRRDPRDVAVLVGDDGGWARFDPRRVNDLWAVAEYRAGRGREPG